MDDPARLSLVQASKLIARDELDPRDLVETTLSRIEQLEPSLHAFVTVDQDGARRDAETMSDEARAGRLRGPLHGIPIGIKDIIDAAGTRTESGSRVRAQYMPTRDAPVVARLKAAGAIIIGKTNTHEFAFGPMTPPTRNAWDITRIPGGSSGGSGTAVAAGMCAAAIGTDTGGSIRIPAAFNGIVGLKPTYGRVPKSGITSLSWSLDHAGPMTRTVEDAAAVLNVIAGRDATDPTSSREPTTNYASELDAGVDRLRLGVPQNYFRELIDPEVLRLVDAAAAHLGKQGADLIEVTVSDLDSALPVALGILLPEASSYHQRDLRLVPELYGIDVRTYLELGEMYLATHYLNAQRARTIIKEAFRRSFEAAQLDALLAPTTPMFAPKVGQTTIEFPGADEQPVVGMVVRTCAPFNLSGQPVLTVACGFGDDHLPAGLAIVGRPFDETTVLRIGRTYESTTEWHERIPTTIQSVNVGD